MSKQCSISLGICVRVKNVLQLTILWKIMFTKTSKLKAHQKKPFTYAHVTKNDKKYIFFLKNLENSQNGTLPISLALDQYLAFVLKCLLLKKGQNVEVQILFTINKTSTIFVQFCSNFQDLFYPWVDQSLKVWVKSDKNCRFFVNGEKNLHFYILTFLKQQTF